MLGFAMLSAIILSAFMLSVIMLSVAAPTILDGGKFIDDCHFWS